MTVRRFDELFQQTDSATPIGFEHDRLSQAFVKLARTISIHKAAIHAAVIYGLSNARVESSQPRCD